MQKTVDSLITSLRLVRIGRVNSKNMRNCASMQKKSHEMKIWARKITKNSNNERNFTKMKKAFPEAVHIDIFVENRYTLAQGHKNLLFFKSYEVPPLASPSTK